MSSLWLHVSRCCPCAQIYPSIVWYTFEDVIRHIEISWWMKGPSLTSDSKEKYSKHGQQKRERQKNAKSIWKNYYCPSVTDNLSEVNFLGAILWLRNKNKKVCCLSNFKVVWHWNKMMPYTALAAIDYAAYQARPYLPVSNIGGSSAVTAAFTHSWSVRL